MDSYCQGGDQEVVVIVRGLRKIPTTTYLTLNLRVLFYEKRLTQCLRESGESRWSSGKVAALFLPPILGGHLLEKIIQVLLAALGDLPACCLHQPIFNFAQFKNKLVLRTVPL